jgi:phage terminase small subunit
MKTTTIHKRASELLTNRAVAERIARFQQETAEQAQLTIDDIVIELEEARQLANPDFSPASP